MSKIFVILFLLFCSLSFADNFSSNASYQVCFTPGENCIPKIVAAIDSAQQQILVQAYSFNQRDIIHALVAAHKRGVTVKILLDKDILNHRALLKYLQRQQLWLKIDTQPAIAHNKVMILDTRTVITGSFNFTFAAAKDNAENVLIISDAVFAQQYIKNWYERERQSVVADAQNFERPQMFSTTRQK